MATTTLPAKTEPVKLTGEERLEEANRIIKKNMYWAMGFGAVPVPLVDIVGVGGFQLRMISDISALYDVPFSEQIVRNIVGALVGTLGARVATLVVVGSMIKTLPFAGALVGGVLAMPAIAGATTYALGKVFVKHFEAGGTLLNLDIEKMKDYFASQFGSGKKLSAEARNN